MAHRSAAMPSAMPARSVAADFPMPSAVCPLVAVILEELLLVVALVASRLAEGEAADSAAEGSEAVGLVVATSEPVLVSDLAAAMERPASADSVATLCPWEAQPCFRLICSSSNNRRNRHHLSTNQVEELPEG